MILKSQQNRIESVTRPDDEQFGMVYMGWRVPGNPVKNMQKRSQVVLSDFNCSVEQTLTFSFSPTDLHSTFC